MNKLFCVLILIILSGCSVERQISRTHRMIEKHPDVLDRYKTTDTLVTVRDTTIFRDTTIYDTIPGEHKIDSVIIPCPEVVIKPLEVKLEHVTAKTWVSQGKLYLDVDMPPMVLKIELDSALAQRNRYWEYYQTELWKPPPEKIIPKWVWFVLGAALVEFVLLLLTILLKR